MIGGIIILVIGILLVFGLSSNSVPLHLSMKALGIVFIIGGANIILFG